MCRVYADHVRHTPLTGVSDGTVKNALTAHVKEALDAMQADPDYLEVTTLFKKFRTTRRTTIASAAVSARAANIDLRDACTLQRCLNDENMSNVARLDLSNNESAPRPAHTLHATATIP